MAKQQICSSCGSQGNTKKHTRGSLLIDIVLWLCGILPGILYSFWRLGTRKVVCGVCSADTLIHADTPRGKQLAREFGA
jgi:hypothetical protein